MVLLLALSISVRPSLLSYASWYEPTSFTIVARRHFHHPPFAQLKANRLRPGRAIVEGVKLRLGNGHLCTDRVSDTEVDMKSASPNKAEGVPSEVQVSVMARLIASTQVWVLQLILLSQSHHPLL